MGEQEVPKTVQSSPRNVAGAIVIKDEDVFFIAERDGGVPGGNLDGFGLYHRDCRYLNCIRSHAIQPGESIKRFAARCI